MHFIACYTVYTNCPNSWDVLKIVDKLLSATASAGATIEPLDTAEVLTATTETSV